MKRLALYVAGMAVAAAAFAAGQATKLKFPWAGDALNRPCGKTELEWRLATKGIRKDEPVNLAGYWMIRELRPEIRAKGVVLHANVSLRPDKAITDRAEALRNGCWNVCDYGQRAFGHGKGKGKPFTYWKNIAIYLSVDGKPAMVAIGGQFQEVTRFPK